MKSLYLVNSQSFPLWESDYHKIVYTDKVPCEPDSLAIRICFNEVGHLTYSCLDWPLMSTDFWCVIHTDRRFRRGPLFTSSRHCDYFNDRELAIQFASLCEQPSLWHCRFRRGQLKKIEEIT